MYNIPHYKEPDPKAVLDFIRQHPFAIICGVNEHAAPVASQVPLFMESRNGHQYLSGHMMRHTDHQKALVQNENVLCVFTGPQAYVSATWLQNPLQASTWNYMSVHIHGKIRFLDEDALRSVLQKTTLYFEDGNTDSPTVFENLPNSYTEKLLPAIVAFEVKVEKIENVFKLSQKSDLESYDNIIAKLCEKDDGAKAVAEEMQKRRNALFKSDSS